MNNGGMLDTILDMVTADVMYIVDRPDTWNEVAALTALCLVLGFIVYRALDCGTPEKPINCKYGFTGNKRICRRCDGVKR